MLTNVAVFLCEQPWTYFFPSSNFQDEIGISLLRLVYCMAFIAIDE